MKDAEFARLEARWEDQQDRAYGERYEEDPIEAAEDDQLVGELKRRYDLSQAQVDAIDRILKAAANLTPESRAIHDAVEATAKFMKETQNGA